VGVSSCLERTRSCHPGNKEYVEDHNYGESWVEVIPNPLDPGKYKPKPTIKVRLESRPQQFARQNITTNTRSPGPNKNEIPRYNDGSSKQYSADKKEQQDTDNIQSDFNDWRISINKKKQTTNIFRHMNVMTHVVTRLDSGNMSFTLNEWKTWTDKKKQIQKHLLKITGT
jgi:hypothetical protein